ncbi:MAG: hypothetical protein M1828_001618 [Chrysothrix sp. TS-e1954]|nr:MAG: hypothetical protein M1828_001618 [Chrysothrix sp. TS-e1954]
MEISSDAGRTDQVDDLDIELDDLEGQDNEEGDSFMVDEGDTGNAEPFADVLQDDPMWDEAAPILPEEDEELQDASQHGDVAEGETFEFDELELPGPPIQDTNADRESLIDQDEQNNEEEIDLFLQNDDERLEEHPGADGNILQDDLEKDNETGENTVGSKKDISNKAESAVESSSATAVDSPHVGTSIGKARSPSPQTEIVDQHPTVLEKSDGEEVVGPEVGLNSVALQDDVVHSASPTHRRLSREEQEYKHEFAKHPVLIWDGEQEYFLFPNKEDHTEPYILADPSIAHAPFKDLLVACREWLGDSVDESFEVELDAVSLGLKIGEDSPYAASAALTDVLELHLRLCQNDSQDPIEPLRVSLTTRHRYFERFRVLRDAVADGKGFVEMSLDDQLADETYPEDFNATGDNPPDDGEVRDLNTQGKAAVAFSEETVPHHSEETESQHARSQLDGEQQLSQEVTSAAVRDNGDYIDHAALPPTNVEHPQAGAEDHLYDEDENGEGEESWNDFVESEETLDAVADLGRYIIEHTASADKTQLDQPESETLDDITEDQRVETQPDAVDEGGSSHDLAPQPPSETPHSPEPVAEQTHSQLQQPDPDDLVPLSNNADDPQQEDEFAVEDEGNREDILEHEADSIHYFEDDLDPEDKQDVIPSVTVAETSDLHDDSGEPDESLLLPEDLLPEDSGLRTPTKTGDSPDNSTKSLSRKRSRQALEDDELSDDSAGGSKKARQS